MANHYRRLWLLAGLWALASAACWVFGDWGIYLRAADHRVLKGYLPLWIQLLVSGIAGAVIVGVGYGIAALIRSYRAN